ncbi:MAG TPA: (2Fe-2S)-binding protein [bacterium]|nr:(2Fe-2S)-binding protein [bacterium]
MAQRITEHQVLGPPPTLRAFHLTFNGREIPALEGDSIASALLAAGIRVIRRSAGGDPRGIYCGIGHCYECRVTVNGVSGQRACLVPAGDGMIVEEEPEEDRDGH